MEKKIQVEMGTTVQRFRSGFVLRVYLEGHEDLVSRLVTPLTHIVTPVIPLINLLTKSS